MKRKTTKEQKVATAEILKENIIAPEGTKIVTQEDIDMKQEVITNHLYQVGNLVAGICGADVDGVYKDMQKAMFTSVIERSSDVIMAVINNMTLEDGVIVVDTHREIPYCKTPESILDIENKHNSGKSPLEYNPSNTPHAVVLDRNSLLEHSLLKRNNTPVTSKMLKRLKSKLNTIDDPEKAKEAIHMEITNIDEMNARRSSKNNENILMTGQGEELLENTFIEKENKKVFKDRSNAAKKGWETRRKNLKKAKRNARKNR